jgi:hypothetical protein
VEGKGRKSHRQEFEKRKKKLENVKEPKEEKR